MYLPFAVSTRLTDLCDTQLLARLARSAKAEGMNISEYTLRRIIRTGKIPCRIVGRTYLISWEKLMSWVNCVDGCDNLNWPQL